VRVTNIGELGAGGMGGASSMPDFFSALPSSVLEDFHAMTSESELADASRKFFDFGQEVKRDLFDNFGLGLPPLMEGIKAFGVTTQNSLTVSAEAMKKNRDELKKTKDFHGITMESLKGGFEQTFTSAFGSVEGGFKGMTGRFLIGFSQMLEQMAAQALAKDLGNLIFGGDGKKGGSGFLSFLSKLFGGGGGLSNPAGSTALSGSGIEGNVFLMASGGLVGGTGTSTSDSNKALLSKGEFVVNAAAVDRYGMDNLRAINSGSAPAASTNNVTHNHINIALAPMATGSYTERRSAREQAERIAAAISGRLG
jgi:hypothetical protein